jgi:hypothetical protein
MTVFLKWRENGWSCMCELLALPACPLHPHVNRDQANSEKNTKDIDPQSVYLVAFTEQDVCSNQ